MQQKRAPKRRIWLWIGGILLVLGLIIGGLSWYFSREWKPILSSQLKQLVVEASDSLYRVEYADFHINLVTGTIDVQNFKLIPNKAVYQKLVNAKKAPDNVYDLQVKNLVINNFHPRLLYSDKKLHINSILINKPTLFITNRRQPYNDTVPEKKPRSLYQIVSKVFKEVRVGQIQLRDIDCTFDNRSDKPYKKTAVKNLHITALDLLIDSLSEQDKSRFYHTRKVNVSLKNYTIATPDSLYHLRFDGLSFSTGDKRLLMQKMSLVPRHSKTQFYKIAGYAKDRFTIQFDKIALSGINLPQATRYQRLFARHMDLATASIDVFKDVNYGRKREDKTGRFPHQLLQKLSLNLKIDTLTVGRADISFAEHNPKSGRTGQLTFNKTYARFYNVTNDSMALLSNAIMKADIQSRFMNTGKLRVNFTFNLSSPKGAFSYSGSLEKMNGKALNKITRPLGLIEVKSAWIEKLSFDINADQDEARGSVQFYYNDLRVNLLKKDEETGELKKQGLISGLTNILVIREDNPDHDGKFHSGTVYYKRIYRESFFALLWKSLFSGVKESVGLSDERENKIRSVVVKVDGFLDRMKARREERKQKRQQKRENRKKEKEQREATGELAKQEEAKRDSSRQ